MNIPELDIVAPYSLKDFEKEVVSSVYPFERPPQEMVDNTYVFTNSDAYISVGYHTTGISTLLRPREDKKVLVPGVALDASYPSMSMRYIVTSDLPSIQDNEAPYFSWFGKKVVKTDMMASWDFEPAKAAEIVTASLKIREVFFNALQGKEPNKEKLEAFFGQFLNGGWCRYYTGRIIDKIFQSRGNPAVVSEVEQTLARVPERMQQAQEAYEKLLEDPDAALLLRNKFKVIFQIKPAGFPEKNNPVLYCDTDIPEMLRHASNPLDTDTIRDPHEILGFPMGIQTDAIERVFFPDELNDPSLHTVRRAFLSKAEMQGISLQKLRPFSEYEEVIYESCDLRYGKFTSTSLREYIENGILVKLSHYVGSD